MLHWFKSLLKQSQDLQRFNDWLKLRWRKLGRAGAIRDYLAAHSRRNLHLGCGTNVLPGWLNTDYSQTGTGILCLDVTEPFPFPTASFDLILAEHIIEHIERRDARKMLAECFRVLRPNGVLRIGTPDLPKYLRLYGPDLSPIEEQCVRQTFDHWIFRGFYNARKYAPEAGDYNPAYVVNDIFLNYQHRFIYDYPLLEQMCRAAGFTQCGRSVAGTSEHAAFHGTETHVDAVNAHLTVTIEATKAPDRVPSP